jgi:hypothetical protein
MMAKLDLDIACNSVRYCQVIEVMMYILTIGILIDKNYRLLCSKAWVE